MSDPYADGNGLKIQPMFDPYADGNRKIWPDVRSKQGPVVAGRILGPLIIIALYIESPSGSVGLNATLVLFYFFFNLIFCMYHLLCGRKWGQKAANAGRRAAFSSQLGVTGQLFTNFAVFS
ncbi:hypothetical protein BDZ97DRAFT_1771961 [Flammula alnicola]|nr:hypothetical protein BDZ97DRAFT_1771961 [Flammula alnicola]